VSGTPALATGAETLLARRLEQRILPGLERMQRALDALGHPHENFTSVLVLGTNGKGSTAALLAGMLQAHGVRAGLYTSPHLVAVEERIRVNGADIAPARLAELVASLSRFPDLSYFETLTCAALLEFSARRVEVAVLEAGLGGRWDASNAVDPAVALLTNVGTDHQKWLGDTRAAIAAEKAAALRGREAIVAAWDDEVEPVIRAAANPATPLSLASEWAEVNGHRGQGTGHSESKAGGAAPDARSPVQFGQGAAFTVGETTGEAFLSLLGEHQLENLRLALAGLAALAKHGLAPALDPGSMRRGIEGTVWPGRLQWCSGRGRRLLVDGAHNREAIATLTRTLDEMGLSGSLHLLFSCLDDKPLEAMADLLRPRVLRVTVAPLDSPRATPLATLAAAFPGCARAANVGAALLALPTDAPTLVTGSLRLAGTVLAEIGSDHG
jgi:dihydrofolate synthase / folylpolyglutamate synthase